ncbi:MAG: IS66 family transposase [Rubrivivax sp.]|nr:IS66 family transposase [Rubrivivax sp.]
MLRELLERALQDLRAARDRLNQTPANSSRPSGSMPPWKRGDRDGDGGGNNESANDAQAGKHRPGQQPAEEAARTDNAPGAQDLASQQGDAREGCEGKTPPDTQCVAAKPAQACTHTPDALPAKRAGRRLGAPGHGREQKLAPTRLERHRPMCCAACLRLVPSDQTLQAWTGWDTLELVNLDATDPVGPAAPNVPAAPATLGLRIEVTRHLLMQQTCACGHTTRAQACRAENDLLWPRVDIGEHRLLGPRLAATVVYLCLRMRLPRRKVSELLLELLGLQLSAALIDQAVHQAARSVAPLQDQLAQQIAQAVILHVDETPWPERALVLWLWVFCCSHTVLYVIGRRTQEMFDNALSVDFVGTLMSDGYIVYRNWLLRLRCWAHLQRKLRGLAESSDRHTAQAGIAMLDTFDRLMAAIFEARARLAQPPPGQADPPAAPPAMTHAQWVERLRRLCEEHRDDIHRALRDVAREFINDWDVIMRPLADPRLPLTNNAAERQLRHYVIARRISYGTRTLVGSNSMALLASVIDTCRLRGANATALIARAIHAARTGLPAPSLPPIAAHLL